MSEDNLLMKKRCNLYKLNKSIEIADLALTEHVFFDKTGTITENTF